MIVSVCVLACLFACPCICYADLRMCVSVGLTSGAAQVGSRGKG